MDDGKALDVVTISLEGKTDIADYMVIASGTSGRHTGSLAENLLKKLRESGYFPLSAEGIREGNWIVVDVGDVIVHIFRPEVRQLYNLEKMWSVAVSEPVVAI